MHAPMKLIKLTVSLTVLEQWAFFGGKLFSTCRGRIPRPSSSSWTWIACGTCGACPQPSPPAPQVSHSLQLVSLPFLLCKSCESCCLTQCTNSNCGICRSELHVGSGPKLKGIQKGRGLSSSFVVSRGY